MIFKLPTPDEPIDQCDILDGCPSLSIKAFAAEVPDALETGFSFSRVLVLTQTCDLAHQKVTHATVALILNADEVVSKGIITRRDVIGPVRAGRVFGWYFLPKEPALRIPECVVDLRQLHTVRLDILTALCRRGQGLARLQPLYREHLAQHFAITYSRIGLPQPYPTD